MIEGTHHDALAGYVANEHIDWTGATSVFKTTGTASVGTTEALGIMTLLEPTDAIATVYQRASGITRSVSWRFKNDAAADGNGVVWWSGMDTSANGYHYKLSYHDGTSWVDNIFRVDVTGEIFFPFAFRDGVDADIDVVMEDTGQIGFDSSGIALKENVVDLPEADSEKILNLRPVKYNRISRPGKDEIGLIAEEADTADIPGLVVYESHRTKSSTDKYGEPVDDSVLVKTNTPVGINKSRLIVPMLKEVQKLKAEIETLKAEVAALKKSA